MEYLMPLLNHPVNYVRYISAYFLLPYNEGKGKNIYYDIINMNSPLSMNARISLQQWEERKDNRANE